MVRLRGRGRRCPLLEEKGARLGAGAAYVLVAEDAREAAELLAAAVSGCGPLEDASLEPSRLEDVFAELVGEGAGA